jgi:hypothetical protein
MLVDIDDQFRERGAQRIVKSSAVKKFRAIKNIEYSFKK